MHIHARTYHDEGVGDGEDDAAGAEERPDGDVSDTGERRRIRGRMLLLLLLLLHGHGHDGQRKRSRLLLIGHGSS
jgi:hypothetical protein